MAIQKSMKDELLAFVLSLTEEEVDKLVNRLPELTSLLEEEAPPSPREHPRRSA